MSTKIALADITVDPRIQLRELDEQTVQEYAENLEAITEAAPVLAYRTRDALLLSDGWHRIEAARRRGWKTIPTEVRTGTWDEAYEAACIENTRHGLRLRPGELFTAIVRLLDHRGLISAAAADIRVGKRPAAGDEQTYQGVARDLGTSERRVRNVADAERTRRALPATTAAALRPAHFEELAQAPEPVRQPLAEAAVAGGWTRDEVRQAARQFNDPTVPEEAKREALAPFMGASPNGDRTIAAAMVSSILKDAKEHDSLHFLLKWVEASNAAGAALRQDDDPFAEAESLSILTLERAIPEIEALTARVARLLEEKKVRS